LGEPTQDEYFQAWLPENLPDELYFHAFVPWWNDPIWGPENRAQLYELDALVKLKELFAWLPDYRVKAILFPKPAPEWVALWPMPMPPPRKRPGRPPETRSYNREEFPPAFRQAAATIWEREGRKPKDIEIAAEMGISEATLYRCKNAYLT
jgi:hypothetical protein